MPHDANGVELKEGDSVIMEFTVQKVLANEEFCNVNLVSVLPCYPGINPTYFSAVNTRQVKKV